MDSRHPIRTVPYGGWRGARGGTEGTAEAVRGGRTEDGGRPPGVQTCSRWPPAGGRPAGGLTCSGEPGTWEGGPGRQDQDNWGQLGRWQDTGSIDRPERWRVSGAHHKPAGPGERVSGWGGGNLALEATRPTKRNWGDLGSQGLMREWSTGETSMRTRWREWDWRGGGDQRQVSEQVKGVGLMRWEWLNIEWGRCGAKLWYLLSIASWFFILYCNNPNGNRQDGKSDFPLASHLSR